MDMNSYPALWTSLAVYRGWDYDAHQAALERNDEIEISLTHPTNFLTEEEVETGTITEKVRAECVKWGLDDGNVAAIHGWSCSYPSCQCLDEFSSVMARAILRKTEDPEDRTG